MDLIEVLLEDKSTDNDDRLRKIKPTKSLWRHGSKVYDSVFKLEIGLHKKKNKIR